MLDPGHTDPGRHSAQGLVPDTVPCDEYPGLHTHEFCANDTGGDVLSVGQRFAAPALHQNPAKHGAHVLP
jgi:hypothetical protein